MLHADVAKMLKLRSKYGAEMHMANATIAYQITGGINKLGKCGIYDLCFRFTPQFPQFCDIFAGSKFVY